MTLRARPAPRSLPGAWRHGLGIAWLAAGLALGAGGAAAQGLLLWATDDGQKLDPTPGPSPENYPDSNHVWTLADSTIRLGGGRNEWIAAQLVIGVQGTPLTGVNVAAGDLTYGAYRIPADSIRLYREHYMLISSINPNQNGKTGVDHYFDALIPFRDPYDSAAGDVGAPFDVPATNPGSRAAVWVDIHLPHDAPAGTYRGTLSVAEDALSEPLPVHLEVAVWDFTLPARTNLPMVVGLYPERLAACEEVSLDEGGFNEDYWNVMREYDRMAREHRFDLDHRHLVPEADFDSLTGELYSTDWTLYDDYMGQVMDGDLYPDGAPPQLTMLPVRPGFLEPFGGTADSTMLDAYIREVVEHFQAKGWPLDRSFIWVYDEPGQDSLGLTPEEVTEIHGFYDVVKQASPLVNVLLTEAIEDSSLLGAADWWGVKGDMYWPPEMEGRQLAGEKAFFYQSYAEPSLGVETIDTYGLAFRTWPWIARRYGVDGMIYWSGNYADTLQPYVVPDGKPGSYNDGEGTFFYPGGGLHTIGLPDIAGPLSSVRMKALRRGMQDVAYLDLLAERGLSARADSLIQSFIPSALCTLHSPNPDFRGFKSRYAGPNQDPRGKLARWPRPDTSVVRRQGLEGPPAALWRDGHLFMGGQLAALGDDSLRIWLLSPAGGEIWGVGTTQAVRWQTSGAQGAAAVDIYLSPDEGATLAETLAVGTADDGEFAWPVTGEIGDHLRCVVRACDAASCALDTSMAFFTRADSLPPVVELLAPDGGEIWEKTKPETLRWAASDNDTVEAIELALSLDGGATFPCLIAAGEANDSIFVWTVPDTLPSSPAARVRITATDPSGVEASDTSEGVFSLEDLFTVEILSPNGGESWNVGTPDTVRWRITGGGDSVRVSLYLSPDGGTTLAETLAVDLSGETELVWTAAGEVGAAPWCVARACRKEQLTSVGDAGDGDDVGDGDLCVQDVSDGVFTLVDEIPPQVILVAPNGGEIWTITRPETLRWTATDNDSVAGLDFFLSTNGGTSYAVTIATGQPNAGQLVWTPPRTVPNTTSALVRVVARDPTGGAASDTSDALFRLAAAPGGLGLNAGLLQNPVLTRYVAVFVLASEPLLEGSLEVLVGTDTLRMAATDTARHVYAGEYVLPSAGVLAISACARDLAGEPACDLQEASVRLIRSLDGGWVRSAHGEFGVGVAPRALAQDTHLLLSSRVAAGGAPDRQVLADYDVGPATAALAGPAEIRFRYGPVELAGGPPTRLGIFRREGESLVPVRSFVDAAAGELVAFADGLGSFALVRSDVEDLAEPLPTEVALEANRPNPFNPRTVIAYRLPSRGPVRLVVYDATGRRVATLADGLQGPGAAEVIWEGRDDAGTPVASGIYFYRLEAGETVLSRKMALVR